MEHISKKINLCNIRSYSPSMINAFNYKSGNFESVMDVKGGDYGLIPTDIELPSNLLTVITEQTDLYVNILTNTNYDKIVYGNIFNIEEKSENFFNILKSKLNDNVLQINYYYIENNNIYSNLINSLSLYENLPNTAVLHKFMTFKHAQEWFLFFKNYYNTITVDKSKKIQYSSYAEYLSSEKGISKTDSDALNSLDSVFNARGGSEMYNFLKNFIFINFPTTLKENNDIRQIMGEDVPYFMSYPQVVQWKSDFKNYKNYGFKNIKDTTINSSFVANNQYLSSHTVSEVCCLYNGYTKKGGDDMSNWLDGINYSGLPLDYQLNTSTFHIPILLSQTINDLGEETPLAEDWVEGKTYKNGEIFIYEGDCMQVSGGSGYSYDSCMNEFSLNGVFNRLNVSGNNSFINNYFTYNENNEYISIPNRWNVAIKCPLTISNCFLINNTIYEQFNSDYITITKQNKQSFYKVEYFGNKQSYCDIGGVRYLGDSENIFLRNIGECENSTSSFLKAPILKNGTFISYQNELYKCLNNKVTIDIEYSGHDSYFVYNNITYLANGDTVDSTDIGEKIPSSTEMDKVESLLSDSYFIDKNKGYSYVIKKYTIYDAFIGSGSTESKLDEFTPLNNVCDLAGNSLKGMFEAVSGKTYPSEGEILKLPYVLYSTNNVSLTDDTYSANGLSESCYYLFGNILTDIKYYRSEANGDRTLLANQDEIYESTENWTKFDYFVKFNYVMGGILRQVKYDNSNDYHCEWIGNIPSESSNTDYNTGVIYEDFRKLELKSEKYYLNPQDFQIIYYINVVDNNDTEYLGSDEQANINISNFHYFKLENANKKYMFDKGYMDSPTFRREYNIGNSSLKKVDTNIYIDRGNASSFTRQFALGECRTLESLKRYQNGSIKIINNNDTNTF